MAVDKVTYTENETKMMCLAFQCMAEAPKIDYAKLAMLGGWTEGSAKVLFGNLKRKVKSHAEGKPIVTPKKSGAPGTPKGKRAASTDELGGESPTKKRTPAKGKKTAAAKKGAATEDDDEEMKNLRIKKEEADSLLSSGGDFMFGNSFGDSFSDNNFAGDGDGF